MGRYGGWTSSGPESAVPFSLTSTSTGSGTRHSSVSSTPVRRGDATPPLPDPPLSRTLGEPELSPRQWVSGSGHGFLSCSG